MTDRKRSNSTARRMSWLLIAGLTAGALLVPAAASVSAADQVDLHCPDGGVKTEANGGTQDAINAWVPAAGTMLCVKAGAGNSGIIEADGVTSLQGYAPDGKDVSYYVIYTTPSEEPSEEPSEQPSEEPSEEPSEQPSEEPSEEPSEVPSGEVEAETGTPVVTLPPTDTIAATESAPSSTGLQVVLLGLAGVLTGVLLLTPATKRNKRD